MTSHASGPTVIAPAADLPDWALRAVDLANLRLGAKTLAASDDFFAEASRMLNPEPAQFVPGNFDPHGKWMDGWESRRKRTAGHDWALVKLGVKGSIRGFDVDTSHFVGNYPPAVSIEACVSATDDVEALTAAKWTEVLPATALGPSSHHIVDAVSGDALWTHLRVNMYPDGGIARLRVYGQPVGGLENADAGQLALHILGVNLDVLLLQIGAFEADLFEHLFQNCMQPAGADVLGYLVDLHGDALACDRRYEIKVNVLLGSPGDPDGPGKPSVEEDRHSAAD